MENREKFLIWTWTIIGTLVICGLSICLYYDYKKDVKMAELGYQKTTVNGQAVTYFQKTD